MQVEWHACDNFEPHDSKMSRGSSHMTNRLSVTWVKSHDKPFVSHVALRESHLLIKTVSSRTICFDLRFFKLNTIGTNRIIFIFKTIDAFNEQ